MLDPLQVNIPLAGVETTLPLLPEQDHLVQVVESAAEANKEGTGLNWSLKLALVNPTTAIDGREVKPNFPLYMQLALQPKKDSTDPEAFQRSLGEAIDALFGTDKSNRPALTHDLIQSAVGKTALATSYVNEWPEGSGNKSNKVRKLKRAA